MTCNWRENDLSDVRVVLIGAIDRPSEDRIDHPRELEGACKAFEIEGTFLAKVAIAVVVPMLVRIKSFGEAVAAERHSHRHGHRLLFNYQVDSEGSLAEVPEGVNLTFKGFVGKVAHCLCRFFEFWMLRIQECSSNFMLPQPIRINQNEIATAISD